MIEIAPRLHVGSGRDLNFIGPHAEGWAFVHAAKEPWHRQFVGYKERAAPQDHPEFLLALRDNRLALNLIDADDPSWIRPEVIDAALAFIAKHRETSDVLVHCNQGHSRGPTIGMLAIKETLPATFDEAEVAYREIYPEYKPANGMREYARLCWGGVPRKTSTSERPISLGPVGQKRKYSIPVRVLPSAIPVTLVCGPPGSGKTTYVNERATPSDIVIDFDDCMEQVGGLRWSSNREKMWPALCARNDMIYRLAEQQTGHAWIIACAPTEDERLEWKKALNGAGFETIVLRTPEEECERRIRTDPAREHAAERLCRAVRSWWRRQRFEPLGQG